MSVLDQIQQTGERVAAKRRADEQAKVDRWTERRNYEWDTRYAPMYQERADNLEQELTKAYQQQQARLAAQLGYAQSAGAGTGGNWTAATNALARAGASQLARARTAGDDMILAGQESFMRNKDAVSAQQQQLALQYEYNKKLAEMNDPSWWEQAAAVVGGVAGMAGGLTGLPINGIGDLYRAVSFQF